MKDQTKLFAGVLAGVALTATVVLLLRDKDGSALKKEMDDFLADMVKSVKNRLNSATDDLVELKNRAVNNASHAIKSKVDSIAADLK